MSRSKRGFIGIKILIKHEDHSGARKIGSPDTRDMWILRQDMQLNLKFVGCRMIFCCFGALRSEKKYHSLKHLRKYLTNCC